METIPAKLTKRLILEIDDLVKIGWYGSRSELLRDAARKIVEQKKLLELEKAVEEDIAWGLHGK